ncbi:MAG TPA: FHA domain-containing protein [Candidatus Binatia bacterium]|nr:FHA domain-containing protein [Candidatus Binatia bacterium]
MASLLIKTDGFHDQVIELKLGLNRFGRSASNDFQIEHPTVSARHCEVVLAADEVTVRDCDSTNGTFVDGEPVQESALQAGQMLRLGDIELLVESTEVRIAIPKFELPRPAPPVVLPNGSVLCQRHPQAQVTHRCTYCREMLCDDCVTRLRRRGGKLLKLCPLCSHKVEPLGGEKKKKKSLLGILQRTVKLPFLHISSKGDRDS